MTASVELRKRIDEISAVHENDGDGGYKLVSSLVSFGNSLGTRDRQQFRDILLNVVAGQEYGLWSPALEAVVQLEGTDATHALARIRKDQNLKPDVEDYLIQALLRHGHEPEDLDHYLRRALTEQRGMAVPNMAALVHVNKKRCLNYAESYFVSRLRSGRDDEVEANVPPFVENFLEVEGALLMALVQRVAHSDEVAAKKLARLFQEYLLQPWIIERLGEKNANLLAQEVKASAAV